VGAANLTAIVVSESDHDLLLRQLEELLALPAGTLVAEPESKQNASLTWPEAEMLRRVNQGFVELGASELEYGALVRSGLTPRLAAARRDTDLAPISTPLWALQRAAEVGAAAAAAIRELGVSVLGDLDSLGRTPTDDHASPPPPRVPAHSVAAAIAGVLGAAQRPAEPMPHPSGPPRPISPLPEF
jgi:hypothetical protein